MTQSSKAILLSSLGLLSLILSSILVSRPSGFNVHSGEVFLLIFALLVGFLIAPSFLFIKAVRIAKTLEKEEEKSRGHKLAILVTAILGLALGVVIIGIIWIIAVPH